VAWTASEKKFVSLENKEEEIDIPLSSAETLSGEIRSVDVNRCGSFVSIAHGDKVDVKSVYSQDQTTIFKSQQMAIHHLVSTADSRTLIVCSNQEKVSIFDFEKVTEISKYSLREKVPQDEDGFVFCAVDPKNVYYAFLSLSRTLYIWDAKKNELVHSVKNALHKDATRLWLSLHTEMCPVRMAWTAEGEQLVIASGDEISFFNRHSWNKSLTIPSSLTSQESFYQIAFSENNRYMAVTSGNKDETSKVSLYFLNGAGSFEEIDQLTYPSPVVCIQFHRSSEILSVSTLSGEMYAVRNFLKNDVSSVKSIALQSVKIPEHKKDEIKKTDTIVTTTASALLEDDFMDAESADEEHDIVEEPSEDPFEIVEEEEEDDMAARSKSKSKRKRLGKKNVLDNSTDEDIPFSEKESKQNSPASLALGLSPAMAPRSKLFSPSALGRFTEQPQQNAFQPGSTQSADGKRFLCYNAIGYIKLTSIPGQDSHFLEVEFHDGNKRSHSFTDRTKFHLADLSEKSYILSNENDLMNPSRIYFGSVQNDTKWEYTFPDEEVVDVVALYNNGDGVAVATTETLPNNSAGDFKTYSIRLLSGSGAQFATLDVEGKVVTMAGKEHLLAYVFYNPNGVRQYSLVNSKDGRVLSEGNLTLTTNADLAWVGFDENNFLYTADTAGVVRLLSMDHWQKWMQVAQLHKYGEHIFVAYVTSKTMFYIRSETAQISVLPLPTLHRAPLELKLFSNQTNGDNAKAMKYEQDFILQNMIINSEKRSIIENNSMEKARFMLKESKPLSDKMIDMDKNILRLTEECLVSGGSQLSQRVLEYAQYLNKLQSVEFARQLARNHKQKDVESLLARVEKDNFDRLSNIDSRPDQINSNRVLPACTRDTELILSASSLKSSDSIQGRPQRRNPKSTDDELLLDQEADALAPQTAAGSDKKPSMPAPRVEPHTPGRPSLFSPKRQKRPTGARRPLLSRRALPPTGVQKKSTPFSSFEPHTAQSEKKTSALESMECESKIIASSKKALAAVVEEVSSAPSTTQSTLSSFTTNDASKKRKRDVDSDSGSEKENNVAVSNKKARTHEPEIDSPEPDMKNISFEKERSPSKPKNEMVEPPTEIALEERETLKMPKFDKAKILAARSADAMQDDDSDEEDFSVSI